MSPVNQIRKIVLHRGPVSRFQDLSKGSIVHIFMCNTTRSKIIYHDQERYRTKPRTLGYCSIQGQPLRYCSLCTHPLLPAGQVRPEPAQKTVRNSSRMQFVQQYIMVNSLKRFAKIDEQSSDRVTFIKRSLPRMKN